MGLSSVTYPKEEGKNCCLFRPLKDSGLGIFQVLQTKSPLCFSSVSEISSEGSLSF